jgi:multidrug transporter EmrE-like cation transporter
MTLEEVASCSRPLHTHMEMLLLILASTAYAIGGLFMKFSNGATRPLPTAAFLFLFLVGAMLQALGMRRSDLGVAYILVLGFEAVLALVFSTWFLRESCSPQRLGAIALILVGIGWLNRT